MKTKTKEEQFLFRTVLSYHGDLLRKLDYLQKKKRKDKLDKFSILGTEIELAYAIKIIKSTLKK